MSDKKKVIEQLQEIQNTLGRMDFTLLPDGTYYKDYGLLDGAVLRIVPHFNYGISLEEELTLVSIDVNSVRNIPIVSHGKTALNEFPRECMDDVATMIATMAPQSRMPLKESYIVEAECDHCKQIVSSFFTVDGRHTCLDCL